MNRQYHSGLGRFTQVDPIGMRATDIGDPQSLNLYVYCRNDPINRTDPQGLFFKKLFGWISKTIKILKWISIALTVAVAILSLAEATGSLVKIFLFFQRHQFLAKVLNFSSRIGTPPIAWGQGTGGLSNFLQQTQEKPIIRDSVTIFSKERWYEKLWKKAGTIARKSGSAIKMAGKAAGRVRKGI